MKIEEINEALQRPIRYGEDLRELIPGTNVHKLRGRTAIKYIGRDAYERRNWQTAMKKEFPPEAPPASFGCTLYGEKSDKALAKMLKLNVEAHRIELPSCAECGTSCKVEEVDGLCYDCHREAFGTFAADWCRNNDQKSIAVCRRYDCGAIEMREVFYSLGRLRALGGECPKGHQSAGYDEAMRLDTLAEQTIMDRIFTAYTNKVLREEGEEIAT